MDVSRVSKSPNAVVWQWQCHGKANQDWILSYHGSNAVLKARHSGLVLTVKGGGKGNGVHSVQYPWKKWKHQQFTLKNVGGGYFEIISINSGKCMDVSGNRKNNGAVIHQVNFIFNI